MQYLVSAAKDELVVNGIGGLYYEWESLRHSDKNLYITCMGYVTAVALGLALGVPKRKVISLEGDGSLLMGMGVLATIGWKKPKNLIVVVFDNECYEALGGLPTATAESTDLTAVGLACNVHSTTASSLQQFKEQTSYALSNPGPHLIVTKVEPGTLKVPPVSTDGLEAKYLFVRQMEAGLGRRILPSPTFPPRLKNVVEDRNDGRGQTKKV